MSRCLEALPVFNHEYRWSFPIGIDQAAPDGDPPLTMQAYSSFMRRTCRWLRA